MNIDIFSVTVALKEHDGFYWTSLPEHQNIQFTEVLSACKKYEHWKVYMFIEATDSWVEIGNSDNK